MTNGTLSARAICLALLLGVAVGLLVVPVVRGASAVEMQARPLVAGRYLAGGWLGIAVTLVNDGEPTEGYVRARTRAGETRRFVEMPSGAHKVVTLYVQPEGFQRSIEVTFDEPNGVVRTEVEVRVLEQSGTQVAIVGDTTGTLRPQLLGNAIFTRTEPAALAPADLPERPEPLAGVSAMVWAGDASSLSPAQARSLERWVGSGGQLIVLGGPDWQARTAAIAHLLPLENLVAVDDVAIAELAAWAGSDAAPVAEATVSTGTLREDARAFIRADDGSVLASLRPIGAGRVVFVGVDLASAPYRGWEAAPQLWERLAPSGSALEQFIGIGVPLQEELDSVLAQALTSLPSLELPPAELLLAVIVAYILLIGPGSYLLLHRLDRRELAWVTAPVLVVVFSATSFGLGRTLKGTDVIVNQVAILRSASGGSAASVETYAGVYSPDRTSFDMRADGDALMGRLLATFQQPGQRSPEVAVEQGEPARLRGLQLGVSGFEAIRAVGLVEHEPALSLTWSTRGDDRVGTVTNVGDVALGDVAWIGAGGGERIGDLGPGASGEFTVPRTNFNTSAASDQIYGFGGFGSGSDEQRRIQLRRQVIDALVGYGGSTIQADTGFRGPFVIGWREGEGPMPVSIEDQEARRFATIVEVIPARPPLGTGAVVVPPHQMLVSVLETAGDAGSAGPGMVILSKGSATFGLALPLEATGLAPSEVQIVIGPDPHTVMVESGSFAGFWPKGSTVSVRDATDGSWIALGDLGERSRFTVEDPSRVVSDAGRIAVRVTVDGDPALGQHQFFVGAQVTGVIAP